MQYYFSMKDSKTNIMGIIKASIKANFFGLLASTLSA